MVTSAIRPFSRTVASILVIVCLAIPGIAGAAEQAATANELLVKAIDASEQARASDTPNERVALLNRARRLLDRIRSEHPDSDLAVKIATDQQIGAFDPADVQQRYQEAFATVCLQEPKPACLEPLARRVDALQNEIIRLEAQIKNARDRIDELEKKESELERTRIALRWSRAQRDFLDRRFDAANQQISQLQGKVDAFKAENVEQENRIEDLSTRLNNALADKVRSIMQHRTEFLERLDESMKDNNQIRVAGDQFVFQSETLFESGSAKLKASGRAYLNKVSRVLRDVGSEMPGDLDWVLRVAGHTDDRPIQTARFPSNWELSVARAVTIVKHLIDTGVAPDRLMAAGFGEYQPIVTGNSPAALRRNRRISFRLTES